MLVPSLVLALVAAATAVPAVPAPANAGVVRIDSGWLRGGVASDHVTYSSIPYAAPPVGERRWRPPARPRPWSGVRDATVPSPYCPQSAWPEPGVKGQEDCLYLDVTMPTDVRPGKRLPVLVWLHGGGFTSGGADEFDGAKLAADGELVVVTANYRLGAFGFLSTPELDSSGGNYALTDQAAALRWVRRNIVAFGGDPRNVTLAGQSAGARAVCAQLASPLSRGLFHKAIVQSGACDNEVPTLAEARAFGAQAVESLGCREPSTGTVAACLRERTPARLLDTLAGVGRAVNGRAKDRPWNVVAGTPALPRQPRDALRDGTAARVPLLVGGTRDEMRSFVLGQHALTADQYRTMLAETFGGQVNAVLAEYPVGDYASPALALATVLSDWGGFIGACPVLRTAEAAAERQPVYAYEFAEDRGPGPGGFPMGAHHSLELPFLWKLDAAWNPYPELDAEQEKLSEAMVGYWSAFAHTGDPNGDGRPRWREFGRHGTVMGLSTGGIAPTPYAETHRCGFWAGMP